MATAVSSIVISGCVAGGRPMDLSVRNVSGDDLYIENVDAPEFAYRPPVGVMSRNGKSTANSSRAVRSAPRHVVIEMRGRPSETVSVPPLPADLQGGPTTLVVVYTRSRRWVTQWEVTPDSAKGHVARKKRVIPDDDDPQFRLHSDLVEAAEAGDVRSVDDLLRKGAPVRWDSTSGNPLVTAALRHRSGVIERLLELGDSAFTSADIENAVVFAANANNDDVSTLRLLISRFGAELSPDARARVLTNAAESHLGDREGHTIPAGPAVRFLIDEAKFDVNAPLSDSGDTLLDLALSKGDWYRDTPLIEFLKARGARSGLGRK